MCPSPHDQSHFSERKYAQANILVPSKNEGQRTNQGRFGPLASASHSCRKPRVCSFPARKDLWNYDPSARWKKQHRKPTVCPTSIHRSSRPLRRQRFELGERRVGRAGLYQRAPTPVPERFMPDTAPDEPGIVGPVGVPPDPPALLLPKPVFG
jgi:hypothetical protein